MSVSELVSHSPRNSLYPLAAVVGVLLGALLLAGASGHFTAIWPLLESVPAPSVGERFALLLPGSILLGTGLANVLLCWVLWTGKHWAAPVALAANIIAAGYFAYLFSRGIPDHPIGVFLVAATSYALLLGGLSLGLTWPANKE